jgi:hypothetical protein
VAPVANRTINGQLAQFVDRIPAEEAPLVAAYFVNHDGNLYVAAMHPVNLLLRDAEKLRTEWATGRRAQTNGHSNAETTWQRSQRERVSHLTGGLVSAKPPSHANGATTTTEVIDVTARAVG